MPLPLGHDATLTTRRTVTALGDQRRASIAYGMGNLGAWAQERYAPDVVDHDDEDFAPLADAAPRARWWIRLRGRAIRWSLVAGVFLAYVNHWPGGH
jgi:hypothetical protein